MAVNPLLVIGIGLMGLGTLLHIVAMATPAWTLECISLWCLGWDPTTRFKYGPWMACTMASGAVLGQEKIKIETNCGSVKGEQIKLYVGKEHTGAWEAVRAFTILGVLAAIGAIIFAVVAAIMNGSSREGIAKSFYFLVIVAAGGAFICIFIGFLTWGRGVMGYLPKMPEWYPSERVLGYSYVLTIVGGLLILAGGGIAGVGGMLGIYN